MTIRHCSAYASRFSLRAVEAARRRRQALLAACLSGAALSPAAWAQTQAQPAAAPAATAPVPAAKAAVPEKAAPLKQAPAAEPAADQVVPSVTVAAERPTNRIDRQVYDVKSDVGSTNNSAADALANVPSVAVDPDGTVSLRGSTNVQILVDGKPSAMLQGENRGSALNAMAADDIESIEVINNPGAQFGNEGGGGPILNLVTRRNKRPGGLGLMNANLGTAGRYNTAVSGTYNEGLFSYQGGVNFRHDGRNSVGEVTRERIDPARGTSVRSQQNSSSAGLNDSTGVNGSIGYNHGDADRYVLSASYNKRANDQTSAERYLQYGVGESIFSNYLRSQTRKADSDSYSWGGRYEHKGKAEGESFKMDLRVSSTSNDGDSTYANVYSVNNGNLPNTRARQNSMSDNKVIDYTGDYELPIDKSVLKLGYKIARTESGLDTYYANLDPLSGQEIVVPSRTNMFDVEETNLALYGSYQMRLDQNWGVLGGLRVEQTTMDIHQGGANTKVDYLNYVPSFFVSYKASDKTNIRLAYAHRIRRPNPQDLNPNIVYRDEFNVSSGNPNLKPSETDSLELGFDTSFGIVDANLRAYFRRESDLITERRYFIGENVLLTTRGNGGNTDSGGLEFSLNGKVNKQLSLQASGNLGYFEQTGLDTSGNATKRNATSLSVRGRMNYQITEADTLQLILNAQGKTLVGQGYREPTSTANVSYRRTLTPRLNLVFNVTDIFDSNKSATVIDSDILKERSLRRFDGRVVYIGLSYRLGGITPTPRAERKDGGNEREPGMQRRGPPGGFGPGGGQGGPGGPGGGGFGPGGAGGADA